MAVLFDDWPVMLLRLREKSSSWILRVLFFLLILSFGAFGLNDFANRVITEDVVAAVGAVEISRAALDRELSFDMRRFEQLTGQALSRQQARDFGLQNVALDRLINRALIDQAVNDLGLTVGDGVVSSRIRNDRSFFTGDQFDPALFQQFLRFSLRMSEEAFVAELRADTARNYMESAIVSGGRPPAPLVERLFAHRFETRAVDWIAIPGAAMADPGIPSGTELETFLQRNAARFTRPVTRRISWLHVDPARLADQVIVPEEDLRATYEAERGHYIQAEHRLLLQVVLPDQAAAEAIVDRLAGGAGLSEAAATSADVADLGWVSRRDLPPVLAEAAFAVDSGATVGPVMSDFGWHVMVVRDVEPGQVIPFEQAREDISTRLSTDLAIERAIITIEQVEDALAGGASLEQAAQEVGLSVEFRSAVSPDGDDGDGNPVDLPSAVNLIDRIFSQTPGDAGATLDTSGGGFLIVRIDGETPGGLRLLSEVRQAVVVLWRDQQRQRDASALADDIATAANSGRTLATLALEHGLTLSRAADVSRSSAEVGVPGPLLSAIFDSELNEAVLAPTADGYAVAVADSRNAASSSAAPDVFEQFRNQIGFIMGNDLLAQYAASLRRRYPVSMNRQALQTDGAAPAVGHGQ